MQEQGWVGWLVEFIDLICCRAIFTWSLSVMIDLGRCLEISSVVRPGQELKNTLLRAWMKVLGVGGKAALL